MRKIIFYRIENGKCPVEEFFNSLTNKQFEKISFVKEITLAEKRKQHYFRKKESK